MLFYASLFLFCVSVSAIALWLYRSVAEISKAAYRAFLPSSKQNLSDLKEQQYALGGGLDHAATPWGWGSTGGPRRAIPDTPVVKRDNVPAPWGWKGSNANIESRSASLGENVSEAAASLKSFAGGKVNKEKPHIGWPYREEEFEFNGTEYKVTRKRRAKKNIGGVSKPWGW